MMRLAMSGLTKRWSLVRYEKAIFKSDSSPRRRISASVGKNVPSSRQLPRPQGPGSFGTKHPFSPSEIREAVEALRRSRALSGCHRLVQFLTFVVEATLSGDAADLKETVIGVSVFGRSPDYDPKVDTIVRSQAWRLRAKLRKYYASEGSMDLVVIDLPIGQYVPVFYSREQVRLTG